MLFARLATAQETLLSFDEHNKYIYYMVEDMPTVPADTLYARALACFKTSFAKVKLKPDATAMSIMGDGKFFTYKGLFAAKHEVGEVHYQVNVEIKDKKYRYWLTGFTYTPYQRDRYNNFVPEPGIEIPLETANDKLDKKDVKSYLDQTGTFCKAFGDKLKLYMINAPKKDESIKKVVTDKW